MTKIFESYNDFLQREEWAVNGVSKEFAEENPDYEKDNESNKGCYNCYGCSDCSGCSDCYDCYDCYNCSGCYGCSGCYDCSDCSGCSGCSGIKNASPVEASEENPNAGFKVPVIENIHQKVYEAASAKNALNMKTWHTCGSTHCRFGWVEFLAGPEGKALAEKTSTMFAAIQIYHKSSTINVPPTRAFDSEEKAMEDMKRCADEEKKLTTAL